jgi:hypothetical protein
MLLDMDDISWAERCDHPMTAMSAISPPARELVQFSKKF